MDAYRKPKEVVLADLKSRSCGLAPQESRERLERYGANVLQTTTRSNPLRIFINQFKSFIIYILMFAVGFSLLIGEWVDAIIIAFILVTNAIIGFCQELSAHRSLEALKKISTLRATVLRGSRLRSVDASELVPGDVIQLEAGDRVPADARILEAVRFKVEESVLTGESLPVEKDAACIGGEVPLGDRHNMLYSATTVATGNARAVVVATGMETELGRITTLVKQAGEELTPLQRRLDQFGKRLGYVILGICALVFVLFYGRAYAAGDLSLQTFVALAFIAISLAVAAVPTALPAVVTIALSIGVKRLLRRQALVRNLSAVETLGSCDVICTDKTGTLTANQMTVCYGWTLDGETEFAGSGYAPVGEVTGTVAPKLFRCGLLCNNASLFEEDGCWRVSGDPTEIALLTSARKAGVETGNEVRWDERPFDGQRKLMSVLVAEEGGQVAYVKGALGPVLSRCRRVLIAGQEVLLTAQLRQAINRQNSSYAARALRVLGFASRRLAAGEALVEEDLTFIGLQAMIDPPRPDVAESLRRTRGAGIRVIMITGDYGETAQAIGREVGIDGDGLSGEELAGFADPELRRILQQGVSIFSRVAPEDKLRIVVALQQLGYTVAMTGDGVNDAPALKQANIGVAVGSGTEVAKEAADFVLLDDSLTHIVNAIEEGRGIYDNIQKSIMLLLSGNLGEVLIIFLAALFGMNLPLTAILLLWINMVTDGAPALAYSVDPYGRDIMRKPPKPRSEGLLPKPKLALLGVLGCLGTVIALGLFQSFGGTSSAPDQLLVGQTLVFNFVVLYEAILTFVIRGSYRVPLWSNGWVWAAAGLSLLLQGVLMYTPLAPVFRIVPLGGTELGALFGGGVVFLLAAMLYLMLAPRGG